MRLNRAQQLWHRHPHVTSGDQLPFGDRAADVSVNGMGSWRFLGAQTLFIVIWMVINVMALFHHWDPYPFILLNLMFSIQAAYAAPLILLAGKRGDTKRAEVAAATHAATERLEASHAVMEERQVRIEAKLDAVLVYLGIDLGAATAAETRVKG